MKYGVRFEQGANGLGAYLPDVPGVAVVGDHVADTLRLLDKALQWHIDALIEDGLPLPEPTTNESDYEWLMFPERTYTITFSKAMAQYVAHQDNVASLWPTTGPFRLRASAVPLDLSEKALQPA